MATKYTKWAQNIPNGCKIDQMVIKCANIFRCESLQNLPKLRFLFLATLVHRTCVGQACVPQPSQVTPKTAAAAFPLVASTAALQKMAVS
jgi:hypothetical protein